LGENWVDQTVVQKADLKVAASAALMAATKADKWAGTRELYSAEQKAGNSVGMMVFQ
jgi:hypothetical protein